ncbi:hypothetical protein Tco_0216690 [Tanacetum coccineum]
MQKAIFKQQFEAFKISHRRIKREYDRFQQLLSQLEAHGAEVSTEDANHKFLRSLPSAWSNLAMTMRTNPRLDNLSNVICTITIAFLSKKFKGANSTCTPSTSSTNALKKVHMDINWKIVMIAIRMKKFYKKIVEEGGEKFAWMEKRSKRETHISTSKKLEAREESVGKSGSKVEYRIVNWGEHTEAEETNHALMAISSSNEVSLCSKTCIDSYNKLKLLYDEQMNQLGDQEAQILAYSQAVKKLEAQLVTSQKQQLSLNEKLAFQANEIHEKDEKLKRYRRIGMKAVKEKEQLQKTVDSWKDSSKNLWRLINSGMSSNDKLALGFKYNQDEFKYEGRNDFSVLRFSKEDSIGKPSYNRFTKTNDGKKGSSKTCNLVCQMTIASERSTCQSNDSEGSCGNTSEHSFETESESVSEPNELSKSRLEVINEKDVSSPKSKEVEPSCVSHIKSPRQPLKDKETHTLIEDLERYDGNRN